MIGPGLPHDRPPLSKRAIRTGRVPYLADSDKLAAAGIRHIDGRVTGTDLDTRRLIVTPTDGGAPLELDAPRLVWATGFVYPFPPVPGIDTLAHQNSTADGMLALCAGIAEPGRRVIVIGAGLIGTETAATLAVAGHQVTLVDMVDRPLARFQPERESGSARHTRCAGRHVPGRVPHRQRSTRRRYGGRRDIESWNVGRRCGRHRRRIPDEPAGRPRARRSSADGRCRRDASGPRSRQPVGMRGLHHVPAPPVRPHRHPALGSRAAQWPPRRRQRHGLQRTVRPRSVLLQRHRPLAHPTGRTGSRPSPNGATRTACPSGATTTAASPPYCFSTLPLDSLRPVRCWRAHHHSTKELIR